MERRLPDWIDSYLDYVDETEPAYLYKAWVAVSTIASCMKRKCYAQWDKRIYPNMYIVLVGPSGCRKGTAMYPASAMLDELGIRRAAESITREALVRELKASSDNHIDPITEKPMMHSSLTIASEELTVFLGYNNLSLISDLTDWYDCKNKWTYRTKNQGTDEILGVWVNLLGATTPDILQATLPTDAIGGGLTSRIIFVYAAKKGKIVPIPFLIHENEQLKKDLVHDLEQILMMTGRFKFSEKFVDTFAEWYVEQEDHPPFDDYRFGGYMQRRPTHMIKMSMVMSVSRSNEMIITEEDFYKALTLLSRTEAEMPKTFGGYGQSENASMLPRIMAEIGNKKTVSSNELMRKFSRDITPKQLEEILLTLEMSGYCKGTIQTEGNMKVMVYTYLPAQ
jgi:hypothetical protein